MATINLIYAADESGCIGKNNALPFKLKNDMQFFKNMTVGGVVVMGRKTYESIGKPLNNRENIIVSANPTPKMLEDKLNGKIHIVTALTNDFVNELHQMTKQVFIVGGAQVYEYFLPYANFVYKTLVHCNIDGDKHFVFNESDYSKLLIGRYNSDVHNEYDHTIYKFTRQS